MKNKKIKNTIILLFLILSTTVLFLLLTNKEQLSVSNKVNLNHKNFTSEEQKFLYDNHRVLDIDKNTTNLELLKSDLEKNEVFLTGERHTMNVNKKLELKFIKYLNKEAGVRYILLERPYGYGEMINKYLDTGDEKILKDIYNMELSRMWGVLTSEKLEYWQNIYKYNKKLKDKDKLKFIGIDYEYNIFMTLNYLISILPEKEAPIEIRENIMSLIELSEVSDKHKELSDKLDTETIVDISGLDLADETIKNISKNIDEHEKLYKSYLGERYFSFRYTVKNRDKTIDHIKKNSEARSKKEKFTVRDKLIYDNFIEIYNKLPKGKYYGQFGASHIFQKNYTYHSSASGSNKGSRFGELLNSSDSPVKNKVLSIRYIYVDGTAYNWPSKEKVAINELSEEVREIFTPFMESSTVLFKLTGEKSPFNRKLIWIEKKEVMEPDKGVTTDYYQYVIIIKNPYPESLEDIM